MKKRVAGDTVHHGAEFRLSKARPKTIGSCHLDPTGPTRLRAALPEENVRQQFIKFLTDKVRVPLTLLTTEDAVSHHGAASKGRMDIFCKMPNGTPLFVAECKRQGLELELEQHLRQVHRYAKQIGCRLAILTNGDETCVYDCEVDDRDLRKCKLKLPRNTVPTFQGMLSMKKVTYDPPRPWHRPAWKNLPDSPQALQEEPFVSMVSTGSGSDRIRWLASLGGLLLDEHGAERWRKFKFSVEDRGPRRVSPTNPSGGRWTGNYRGFLVTQGKKADPHIVRFAMLADWKGGTTLVVAVDDEDGKTCNHLQLDMDSSDTVEESGGTASIWHNGRLPGGKKGWTKAALIDYARGSAPRLVKGEYVRLGKIPINRHVEWLDAREFITNCIEYALLRKRFKDEH